MSLRPSNPKKITLADLEPGDVLLSCGDNPLDQLITLVDQGDYSHVSLVTEMGGGKPMVVEATEGGIKHESIGVDISYQYLIDAYRYVSPQGFGFKDPGWPVAPVLDQALDFVGANYAYSELFLAGVVLLAADKSSNDPDLNALIRLATMVLAAKLEEWLQDTPGNGKTPMTCVQVATAAYWQAPATPSNKYGLEVQLVRPRSTMANASIASPSQIAEWRQMRGRIKNAMDAALPHTAVARPVVTATATTEGLVVTAGSSLLAAGMCTPRDMETSPTLKFVGCLKDTRLQSMRSPSA